MAKKTKKASTRKTWSAKDDAAIRKHSRIKSRVSGIAKLLKRSETAIRQRAYALSLPIGHQR